MGGSSWGILAGAVENFPERESMRTRDELGCRCLGGCANLRMLVCASCQFRQLRGHHGALDVVKLAAPKSEDALLVLARVLADKIGANETNMAKWSILTGKPGAEIRRQLKAEHGKNATQRTLTSAYDVAVERGWLIEDNDDSDGGDNAKIPRIPAAEVVECLY